MTTSGTQIGYLDLAAFYQQAKSATLASGDRSLDCRWLVGDVAAKLMCVIDAIRDDGLDPRWNPERDALSGIVIGSHLKLNPIDAETIVDNLHQRGYKIVKE